MERFRYNAPRDDIFFLMWPLNKLLIMMTTSYIAVRQKEKNNNSNEEKVVLQNLRQLNKFRLVRNVSCFLTSHPREAPWLGQSGESVRLVSKMVGPKVKKGGGVGKFVPLENLIIDLL